ncbi:TetR family transcriptional regulator [Pseudomonas sp. MS19]|uniref:TetR/AcrR family transcriptional regulator n=1 Tax=Pseudomonas sp. MS19 TaxID=2579939 RepID=UPI0031F603B3
MIPTLNTPKAKTVADTLQYQGRKASRAGSELRRQAILDATMRLIVREGVRAVRHRAVAAEAQVPLSATTYYFDDIDDLISDTFTQFVEQSAANLEAYWSQTENRLFASLKARGECPNERQVLADELAQIALDYVVMQLTTRRDQLIAGQAFYHAALFNPGLHELWRAHRKMVLFGVSKFFEALGSDQPFEDSRLLMPVILQMEYQGLIDGVEVLDKSAMLAILKRHMYLVLKLA